MTKPRLVGVTLIAALLVAVVAVGGYQFHWWLKANTKDHQVSIDNHNKGAQGAWRDEVLENIGEIETLKHSPQTSSAIAALTDTTCNLIGRLTSTYRSDDRIVTFWERECL